jgi:hypothetical protein
MKYFLNLFFLLVILLPCRAQKVKPALHLSKGETYYMVSTGSSAMVQSMSGHENKINLTLSFKMAFKVIDVMDSVYNMAVNYQSLDMKIQMADTTIDMDSKKANALDVPSSIIAAMMDKPFNIILTKSGKIRSVENIDKLIADVFSSFPQIDAAKKEQLKSQFMQSFGPNAFKGSLEMGTAIFPEAPVAKNDKWTVNTNLAAPAVANVQTVYQLIDVNADFYQIHGDGTMATDKNGPPAEINGLPMKYQLSGTILTDIKVDKRTGWISEVKSRQLMSGNIEILDNPRVPGGMVVPMTFNTEVTTTGN